MNSCTARGELYRGGGAEEGNVPLGECSDSRHLIPITCLLHNWSTEFAAVSFKLGHCALLSCRMIGEHGDFLKSGFFDYTELRFFCGLHRFNGFVDLRMAPNGEKALAPTVSNPWRTYCNGRFAWYHVSGAAIGLSVPVEILRREHM